MTTTTTPTLAQRSIELSAAITRLRIKFWQASAKLEVTSPQPTFLVAERREIQSQLKVLVPMHRALKALVQQGQNQQPKAQSLYLKQYSNALSLVLKMLNWAQDTETEYTELLALRLPATIDNLCLDGAEVITLHEWLEHQRSQVYARKVAMSGIVSRFVKSLTPAQRELVRDHEQLSKHRGLCLTEKLIEEYGHA